jgi:hypothetical protein
MPNPCNILEARTEERPVYFDFKKCDFVTHAVSMANLNYDPFPNNGLDDFVRRELVCEELVLTCKIKSDQPFRIRPGETIDYEGHKFAITKSKPVEEEISKESGLVEVEGSCFLTPCEPMKVLARLRVEYARASSQPPKF